MQKFEVIEERVSFDGKNKLVELQNERFCSESVN